MEKLCDGCGGSGQISFFKGESRFLLSSEDCPECAGMGYILADSKVESEELADQEVDNDD